MMQKYILKKDQGSFYKRTFSLFHTNWYGAGSIAFNSCKYSLMKYLVGMPKEGVKNQLIHNKLDPICFALSDPSILQNPCTPNKLIL